MCLSTYAMSPRIVPGAANVGLVAPISMRLEEITS